MADSIKLSEPTLIEDLFKAHARRVRSFLRWRLRSDEDAQDAGQEVFLKLWRREKEGGLQGDASKYLGSAVFNAAIDVDRARAYRRPADHLPLDEMEVASSRAEPAEALFWRNALSHLTAVLNELPDITQRIFVLYHIEGLTHRAIAGQLAVTVRTVERHMARAIEHCETRMKDYL